MSALTQDTRDQLKRCSSATLSTLLFKRGLRNAWLHGVRRVSRASEVMVGEAFTLRNIPCREDIDQVSVFENRDMPQRKAIETCPPGHVMVVDCRGDTHAASGGGILMTRLAVRGVAGFVSDGCLRDYAEVSAMDFPLFCAGPAAPLNLVRHHAIDINVPIGCGGVAVYPGDVVVGDADGVAVIPAHLAGELAEECLAQEKFERFVMQEVQAGKSVLGLYPPDADTRARYAEWQKKA